MNWVFQELYAPSPFLNLRLFYFFFTQVFLLMTAMDPLLRVSGVCFPPCVSPTFDATGIGGVLGAIPVCIQRWTYPCEGKPTNTQKGDCAFRSLVAFGLHDFGKLRCI